MSGQKYNARQEASFFVRTSIPVAVIFFGIVIFSFVANGFISPENFKPVFLMTFILAMLLSFASSIFSRVGLSIEGNMIVIKNKFNKKEVRIPVDNSLELETIKKEHVSKNSVQTWYYILRIEHGGEKPISLRFDSKATRTEFCQDLKMTNQNFDITNLDLSEDDKKIASISDIISIFRQTKSKTADDVIAQPTSETNTKSEYGQDTPTNMKKTNTNMELKLPEMLRAVFVVLIVVVVVYYYIVYIK